MGTPEHMVIAANSGGADAVAMADILHYQRASIGDIRAIAKAAGIGVRQYAIP